MDATAATMTTIAMATMLSVVGVGSGSGVADP
jgi:hypothetical protein